MDHPEAGALMPTIRAQLDYTTRHRFVIHEELVEIDAFLVIKGDMTTDPRLSDLSTCSIAELPDGLIRVLKIHP